MLRFNGLVHLSMEDSSNSEAHALKRWTVRTEPGGQHFLEVRCKEKPRRSAQCSRWARNAALPHGAVDLLGDILLDGHLDLQAWSFAEITDAHWSQRDTEFPRPGLAKVKVRPLLNRGKGVRACRRWLQRLTNRSCRQYQLPARSLR